MRIKSRAMTKLLVISSIFLAACAGAIQSAPDATSRPKASATETRPSPEPTRTDTPDSTGTPVPNASPSETPFDLPPAGAEAQFKTDFSVHSIPYSEILSGGPPKDGIPSIDDPKFISTGEADTWLEPVEPVIFVRVGDDARAYPLQVFMWHEIVNDIVGDVPLVVTFCPLCNTAIAFERTVEGEVFDFGTTGRLRYSNLIMYDRQTETWWQQATGEAVVGELTGTQLVFRPAAIISWEEFKSAHPAGKVLSQDTGFSKPYGRNPYAGYDDVRQSPFLYFGPETPGVLLPMARVLTVELNDETVAYPYKVLESEHVVNDTAGGKDVVVLWTPGTASALDEGIVAAGRDVGAANVYERSLDGDSLTFTYDGSGIVDEQTGSEWDVLGRAVSGELAGTQLAPVVSVNHFWFSWAAFRPETRVYQP